MTIQEEFYERKRKEMPVYVSKGLKGYTIQIPEMGRVDYDNLKNAESCLKRLGYKDVRQRVGDYQ
jgi:hypothetical protein